MGGFRWAWALAAAVWLFAPLGLAQTPPEQPKILAPLKKGDRVIDRGIRLPPGALQRAPLAIDNRPILNPQSETLTLRAAAFVQTRRTIGPAAGSYQQSCRNIAQSEEVDPTSPWRLVTLSAECATPRGAYVRTSLNDPDQCNGDIWNDNGVLGCTRPPGAFLTPVTVAATPPSPTPPLRGLRVIPAGSYRTTCQDIYIKPGANELRARCQQRNGQWRDAAINLMGAACASYSNDNGWLSCDTAPLPQGPWRTWCRSPSAPSPDIGFAAVCPRPEGGMLRSWIGPCAAEVDTLSGYLTCGLVGDDLPVGPYRNACSPTGWSVNGPTLHMSCWRASFIAGDPPLVSAFSVNLAPCGRPFTLAFDDAGTLRCKGKQ